VAVVDDYGDTYLNENGTYWNANNNQYYGSAKSYIPEIPWNDSCASALLAQYYSGSSITYGISGFCTALSRMPWALSISWMTPAAAVGRATVPRVRRPSKV